VRFVAFGLLFRSAVSAKSRAVVSSRAN